LRGARTQIRVAPGASLSSEDVLSYSRRKLPPFKAPKSVLFLDELPKNARGKIDRKALVEICATRAATPQG
jgi:acyl-CoA synthetase (AMP-forming)/AMP-acid ligase II